MRIAKGDKVPSARVWMAEPETASEMDSAQVLGQGLVVMFAVPGAFTPTCHMTHLPGFIRAADEFFAAGVNAVICASVNDHFVMRAWAKATGAFPAIGMLADGNGELAAAMGLDQDVTHQGRGRCFVRSALVIRDGTIENVTLETGAAPDLSTGAPEMLRHVKALRKAA
ncbi:MAG: peroxiredoxin [Alphaproteobacteria bacterium]|nr:peroxiredoxin [Alphaproteobacteria bacterium]